LILPLFFVSEGSVKAESFTIEKMTPRNGELYLQCWDPNLDWVEHSFERMLFHRRERKGGG
jgi:hypothetical protein